MSDTLWTPGPWSTGGIFNPGDEMATMNIWSPTPQGCQSGYVIASHAKIPDARLIAAAPKLYIALEKAVYELNTIRARDGKPWTGVPIPMPTDVCEKYFSSVVDECFAVLAEARGEAPHA